MGVKLKQHLRAVNPSAKLLFLCALGFVSFSLPLFASTIFFATLVAFSLAAGMDARKILKSQRVSAMYFSLLYALTVLENTKKMFAPDFDENAAPPLFAPDAQTVRICLQIACAIQCALLLYHTTTQLEIRKGISAIEYGIKKFFCRKKEIKLTFSHSLSLMLTFIPEILSTWEQLEYAWKARGGKNGVRKIWKLLPLLISLSMHKAYQTALAVMNRSRV